MFEELRELTEEFSYRSSVIRTNIVGSPIMSSPMSGGRGGRSSGGRRGGLVSSAMLTDKFLSTYYVRMQELRDYEVTELSNIVVGVLKDYMVNYLNKGDIITLKGAVEGNKLYLEQCRINKIFKELGIVSELKKHISDIIYNGQYCIRIGWDKEAQRYVKYNLENPYTVVSVIKNGELDCHLVLSKFMKIQEVAPYSILRFGKSDLYLINDMRENYQIDDKEDTIVNTFQLVTGSPLYYNLTSKVKEYLLKDQVISLLAIKDLVQPLLLLLRVDKATPIDEVNRLTQTTENMINKYSDISSILSAGFSINDLLDSLLNNVKVMPDYSSVLGDMSTVDISKVTNKMMEFRGDQELSRENLLTSLGVPRALFVGDVSKWEAIKASERLNSKISTYITHLVDSVTEIAANLYYLNTGQKFVIEDIECTLFTKTPVDYNTSIAMVEIMSNIIGSVNQLLDSAQLLISNNKLIEVEGYYNYVMAKLRVIDPDILEFVSEEQMKILIDEMAKMKQMQMQMQMQDPNAGYI